MGAYIDRNGNYYEGDKADYRDREATPEEIQNRLDSIAESAKQVAILASLADIDKQTIRAIREYLTGDEKTKVAALEYLNVHETNAKAERAKLK